MSWLRSLKERPWFYLSENNVTTRLSFAVYDIMSVNCDYVTRYIQVQLTADSGSATPILISCSFDIFGMPWTDYTLFDLFCLATWDFLTWAKLLRLWEKSPLKRRIRGKNFYFLTPNCVEPLSVKLSLFVWSSQVRNKKGRKAIRTKSHQECVGAYFTYAWSDLSERIPTKFSKYVFLLSTLLKWRVPSL